MADYRDDCVLIDCDRPAEAGRWCRPCWESLFERDVKIESFQVSEYLARDLIVARRQLDFVVAQSGIGNEPGACCGHMMRVHSDGGCHGLSRTGGFDEWGDEFGPCRCDHFTPLVGEPEA